MPEPLSPPSKQREGQRARSDSQGLNQAMMVLSYLIAGVGFWGFVGWLGARFLGLSFLLPVGIVLGAGLAIYLVIKRFGELPSPPRQPGSSV